MDEVFSDDDCGEEGFDEEDADAEASLSVDVPDICFQWETLQADDSVGAQKVHLNFLHLEQGQNR